MNHIVLNIEVSVNEFMQYTNRTAFPRKINEIQQTFRCKDVINKILQPMLQCLKSFLLAWENIPNTINWYANNIF